MKEIIIDIIDTCQKHSNAEYGTKMKWYMKDHFEFYGINAPLRKVLVKEIKSRHSTKDPNLIAELSKQLWSQPFRELQYVGLDLMLGMPKSFNPTHLPTFEYLITSKSWWDTVDMIAPNLVGRIWSRFPESRDQYLQKWVESDNMWLNRSAIIYQLKYKEKVDKDILAMAILTHENSKEFFIRKAQGWALRELSKVDPRWVKDFLDANPQLSGLTHREGSKYIM